MVAAQDPFTLLRQMAQESTTNAPGLPQETETRTLWSGVAFRLGEMRLVAPLDQVREVLPCPSMTLVPNTKSWLKGVANVRGNLITIVDLPEYFGKSPVFMNDDARLMILNNPILNTGVVVHEVLGLRHFDTDLERQDLSGLDDPVLAHLNGSFLHDNVLWGVFDMRSLAEAPAFRHVVA